MKRLFYFPLVIILLASLVSGFLPLGQGVAYASPGTERQSPDTILAINNLTPNDVTYIQDDPDTPDGNWLVASGNNVNTDVRTSFPTPSGSPTVGADLQEFRAQVRQFNTGQTGTPSARIELWENDALVRAGSNVNVTGSGQVISFTWNANELGTADGSLVEAKVVGTKSGGAPGARNTVDVGAIEWNVDYTAAPNISNTPVSFDFGPVTAGSTPNTGSGHFTITNSSNVTIDITIKCNGWTHTAGSNDWIYGASAENTARLKASNDQGGAGGSTGAGNYDIIVPSGETGTLFCDDVATTTTTINWELQIEAPSSFAHGDPQTTTVTLTATQA